MNAHLADAGIEQRMDHRSYRDQGFGIEPARTVHVGQGYAEARDRVFGSERILPVDRLGAEQSSRNAELIRDDPAQLLDRITTTDSVFSRESIARRLHRYVNEDWREFQATLDAVLSSKNMVQLQAAGRSDTGREVAAIYTTRDVLEREGDARARRSARRDEGKGAVQSRVAYCRSNGATPVG